MANAVIKALIVLALLIGAWYGFLFAMIGLTDIGLVKRTPDLIAFGCVSLICMVLCLFGAARVVWKALRRM